jgi:hypothetical protein
MTMHYLEALWPASPGFGPLVWADEPTVKDGRIVTGSLGPRVRCVKRIADEHAALGFAEVVAIYRTKEGEHAALHD